MVLHGILVHTHARTQSHKHTVTQSHKHTKAQCVPPPPPPHTNTLRHACTCTHTHTHTEAHTHAHTHTHTHTHTQTVEFCICFLWLSGVWSDLALDTVHISALLALCVSTWHVFYVLFTPSHAMISLCCPYLLLESCSESFWAHVEELVVLHRILVNTHTHTHRETHRGTHTHAPLPLPVPPPHTYTHTLRHARTQSHTQTVEFCICLLWLSGVWSDLALDTVHISALLTLCFNMTCILRCVDITSCQISLCCPYLLLERKYICTFLKFSSLFERACGLTQSIG